MILQDIFDFEILQKELILIQSLENDFLKNQTTFAKSVNLEEVNICKF